MALSLANHPSWLDSLLFAHLYIHGPPSSNIITAASQTKHCKLNQELSNFQPKRRKEELAMISSKSITQLTKKWQRMTSLGRKHLIWETEKESDECCASVAGKGHCVVCTVDGRRFEVPLAYLGNKVFEELLRMSQEEFGGDGRITLPCDSSTMEYAMCLLRRNVSADVEKAFLSTMEVTCNYASGVALSVGFNQQVAV
ncbi:hypothetical protein BS78_09G198200 [Paspalum vaginatum]|nr:hypothetical protein BS78_09G198200 [Paspalum vaginatum]